MVLKILFFLSWGMLFLAPGLYLLFKRKPKSGLLWILFGVLVGIVLIKIEYVTTEALWFKEVGHENRFWIALFARGKLFFSGIGFFSLFAGINLLIMNYWDKRDGVDFSINLRPSGVFSQAHRSPLINRLPVELVLRKKSIYVLSFIIFFMMSIIAGYFLQHKAHDFLVYKNGIPFGWSDPVFNKDIGFYVFSLPFLIFITRYAGWLLSIVIASTGVLYYLKYRHCMDKDARDLIVGRGISHLSGLGFLLMPVFIFSTRISIWQLLFSTRGSVFGAGWTDIHVRIGAYWVFIFSLAAAAAILAVLAFKRSLSLEAKTKLAASGLLLCAGTFIIGVLIVPALIQRVWVSPNELTMEREYIKRDIAYTRFAYGLTNDKVGHVDFPLNETLDKSILSTDGQALETVGLLGASVFKSITNQNEAFRLYYFFNNVDVVRYRLKGKYSLLLASARELNTDRLAENSKTWQNTRLIYTHGFGAVASPTGSFTEEGLPEYYLKGIPPVSEYAELRIKEPRIYFGEQTTNIVYVNTSLKEFDYPRGDENAEYSYEGKGGILLDTFRKKLLFAFKEEGLRLLTSSEITDKSRIMIRRDLRTRVETIAPFLVLDEDVYQVIADGKLYYIWDAYTATDKFPYSEPYKNRFNYLTALHWDVHGIDTFNYIRNTVKVVVDAFDGTVDFYIFDESDPLIRTYRKVFPIFKPASEMPAGLRAHVRYPQGLLKVQGAIYADYHMDNPGVFYNKEDAWEISRVAIRKDEVVPFQPYYTIMRIPGSERDEFVIIYPFSPLSTDPRNPRNNMVSVLVARCDGEQYGKLILLKFPKDKLVYGPLQIGMRIKQDQEISKDLALWNQQGSNVLFGTLYILPLSGYRMLYIQPIYLQAEVGKMPELKRVVVASAEQLAYGTDFHDALGKLLLMQAGRKSANVDKKTRLIKDIADSVGRYKKLTGEGRFSEAGKLLESLESYLRALKADM